MKNIALLIVDVQTALIDEHPYNQDQFIKNINDLISEARKNNKEVIFVRHDDGEGSELALGAPGWEIYKDLHVLPADKIFEKQYNSAFHKTDLDAYLKSKDIDTLVIMGLQTEYCIDATLKQAFSLDYEVLIPKDTNTTFDNDYLSGEKLYEFYNKNIWAGRFGEVLEVEVVKEKLTKVRQI
ncbi:cysteine hydrolase family protein [Fusibacter ferrireducens]|uniref:Cysteine hydrolase n=1 Tax=Fusibacter ferrireducens TaxID=2785058 RepID=A0ABR9ZW25_9FIRM|nr:cysteine hydrolase family protein [Fusibacter ferrireducens]MBF4694660.1 cysteine hydrolase [Fusibacter ferrireducens]